MIFKELLIKTNWPDVFEMLNKYYPDVDQTIYKNIYYQLLSYEPIEDKNNTNIVIEYVPEDAYDVFATENGEGQYGLDLTPWKEWLGFNVKVENMSYDEFAAHCLWEMTFYGGEESIERISNNLIETGEKIKNGQYKIVEETCSFCDGTGETLGLKCFCNNGKMSVIKYI